MSTTDRQKMPKTPARRTQDALKTVLSSSYEAEKLFTSRRDHEKAKRYHSIARIAHYLLSPDAETAGISRLADLIARRTKAPTATPLSKTSEKKEHLRRVIASSLKRSHFDPSSKSSLSFVIKEFANVFPDCLSDPIDLEVVARDIESFRDAQREDLKALAAEEDGMALVAERLIRHMLRHEAFAEFVRTERINVDNFFKMFAQRAQRAQRQQKAPDRRRRQSVPHRE